MAYNRKKFSAFDRTSKPGDTPAKAYIVPGTNKVIGGDWGRKMMPQNQGNCGIPINPPPRMSTPPTMSGPTPWAGGQSTGFTGGSSIGGFLFNPTTTNTSGGVQEMTAKDINPEPPRPKRGFMRGRVGTIGKWMANLLGNRAIKKRNWGLENKSDTLDYNKTAGYGNLINTSKPIQNPGGVQALNQSDIFVGFSGSKGGGSSSGFNLAKYSERYKKTEQRRSSRKKVKKRRKKRGWRRFFSDIRLKQNIVKMGVSSSGIPIYNFNYTGDNTIYQGVMAQDLVSMGYNNAVTIDNKSGYYMVDYDQIDVDMITI
tara:strand:+ start:4101 stop:5039 length:939 start_codon:yes stop_codon:yes gene_type:complete